MGNRKEKKIMKRVLAVMLSLALAFTFGISVMPETVRADDKIDFNVSSTYVEVTPNFDWPIVYDEQEHDLTDVTVKVNGKKLTKGTDYTVEYDKTYWSAAAKADDISTAAGVIGSSTETLDFPIIVKGTGNYTGTWRSELNGSGYYSNYANDGRYRIMPHVSKSVTRNIPGEWKWTLDVDGTLTLEGLSAMPDVLNANNEVYGWRDYKQYIKKVVFNNTGTVTSICDSAFAGCANLKEVILPALNVDQGLGSIGSGAFYSCQSLRSIHLADSEEMPSTLTTIKSSALGINTYNLEAHLPDNVSTIEINNVRDTNRIYCRHNTTTEATLKATKDPFLVEGYEGFYVRVGNSGTSLGDHYTVYKYSGQYNEGGNEIILPDFVEGVGYSGIFGYTGGLVTGLTIPGNIQVLNVDAFGAYNGITNCETIEIKAGNLTTLPSGIFSTAPNATITIPDTVTTVSGDPGGTNALLIVGRDSAALTWAKANNYAEDEEGTGTTGKRFMIRKVSEPSITPITASMDTAHYEDVVVTKNDGSFVDDSSNPASFTFVGLKNGNTELTENTHYTVDDDTVTIKKAYLQSLGAGTHTITFDYNPGTGDGNIDLTDPTLTITIAAMASPDLTIKGNNNADVTENCTVVWKNAAGTTLTGDALTVPSGTALTYTITPGDALKESGIQYYKTTTGTITLTSMNQAVEVPLDMQGTVTVAPKNNNTAIPNTTDAGYTVKWYESAESTSALATGVTSPMKDKGTTLYYEITMTGKNQEDYSNVAKTAVQVGYGKTTQDVAVVGANNITLNISGKKRTGSAAITADDYTVTWYTMKDGAFVSTGKTGTKLISPTVGTDYYYEIAPKDRYSSGQTSILNWLEFNGVPASDSTKVRAEEEAKTVNVALTAVETTSLTVTVTNKDQVGSGLTLSVSQTPWSGYQSAGSSFSYTNEWTTINSYLKNNNNTATVYKFDTTVKAEDTAGNFASAYTTVKAVDNMSASLTLTAEAIPDSLPLTITSQYPLRTESNYNTSNLSASNRGEFDNMTFTLKNGDTVINSEYYTVTPTEVRFTNSEQIKSVVSMNNTLTLSATFKDGTQATWTTRSSDLKVEKKITGTGFALAYSEYGRVYFTTETRINHLREAYGIYNANGNLVDSGSGYTYSGGVTTGKLAPGTYILAVWREEYCTSAPGTLTDLNTRLSYTGGALKQSVTIENGKLIRASLGTTPTGSARVLFTTDSGFTQETVETGLADWKLVKLNYVANTSVVPENASYEITVTTFPNYWGTTTAVLPRYEEGHTGTVTDKYISLYTDDVLVASNVKINTSNGNKVDGFTLYTNKPTGSIYFYVQALDGGDFNITAEGVVKNNGQTFNGNGTIGKMVLAAEGEEKLNFTSDYLRTKDNGGSGKGNGVWFNTAPNADTALYMDGQKIATGKSNNAGVASFCFTMDLENGVGTVPVTTFWNADHNWTLAGYHELYAMATATVGGEQVTYRTNTSAMKCVTAQAFTPAEITKVVVTTSKEFLKGTKTLNDTLMEWNGSTAPTLTSTFWTPFRTNDECLYTFTVTVENADAVLRTDAGNYGLMLVAVGEDGSTRAAMLIPGTEANTFTGEISGKDFYFTSWAVTVYSQAEQKAAQSGDFLDVHGSEKILDPVKGTVVTVNELYNNIKAEYEGTGAYQTYGSITAENQQTAAAFKFDVYKDYLKALAQTFYGVTHDDDWWDSLTSSADSMNKLYEVFGYEIGTAVEAKTKDNYENWDTNTYTSTTLSDGRKLLHKEEYTEKNGKVFYIEWTILTPKDGDETDEGWALRRTINLGQNSGFLPTAARMDTGRVQLMSFDPGFGSNQTPYNPNIFNPNKLWSMSKQAYQNSTGNMQIASERDKWNVKSEYSAWKMKKDLLTDTTGTGAQQEYNRMTSASTEDYLTALKDAGSKQIGEKNHNAVTEALDAINKFKNKYGLDNVNDAVDRALDNAQHTLNAYDTNLKSTDVMDLLKAIYDDANGIVDYSKYDSPDADPMMKYNSLAYGLWGGEFYSDSLDLLAAMQKLQKALNDMGAQGNIFDGKGGVSARALKDPQGIVYEAVLSNPVQGATATLYEKTNENAAWNATEYGQVNPQTTGPDGQFQWFVPEGEWQVRITRPADRADLQDNTSAGHVAANLDDGSTAGWLPVMPVQMGINIPLTSTADPTVSKTTVYKQYAEVEFSLYMDEATLVDNTFTVTDSSGNVIRCIVSYPDEDVSPTDNTKKYAKTVRLTPVSGTFNANKTYKVTASINATAYNNKALTQNNYDSGLTKVTVVDDGSGNGGNSGNNGGGYSGGGSGGGSSYNPVKPVDPTPEPDPDPEPVPDPEPDPDPVEDDLPENCVRNEDGTLTYTDEGLGSVTIAEEVLKEGVVYRMYNPNSGEHFYTMVAEERDFLVSVGWNYESESCYTAPGADSDALPVYRLYDPIEGKHHFTLNKEEALIVKNAGWIYEGISFYAYKNDSGKGVPVYRAYNPNNGQHNFTTDKREQDLIVGLGWIDEGIAWNVAKPYTDDGLDSVPIAEEVKKEGVVYRMYNPNSGEHFYTMVAAERDNLISAGWNYESGSCFTAPGADSDALPVYRLYDPNDGRHHFTLNKEEALIVKNAGWIYEGISLYAYKNDSGVGVPVYRAYNPNDGHHNFTTDRREQDLIVGLGWIDEGIAWNVAK